MSERPSPPRRAGPRRVRLPRFVRNIASGYVERVLRSLRRRSAAGIRSARPYHKLPRLRLPCHAERTPWQELLKRGRRLVDSLEIVVARRGVDERRREAVSSERQERCFI